MKLKKYERRTEKHMLIYIPIVVLKEEEKNKFSIYSSTNYLIFLVKTVSINQKYTFRIVSKEAKHKIKIFLNAIVSRKYNYS